MTVAYKDTIYEGSLDSQILEGTSGDDILIPVNVQMEHLPFYLRGLDGDDVLVGGYDGLYNMEGGAGDDLFIFSGVPEVFSQTGVTFTLHSVDGGDGFDTVKFSSELFSDTFREAVDLQMDLVEDLKEKTNDIEMLDFEDGRATTVRVDPDDVLVLSGLEFVLSEGSYSNAWDDDIRSALFITGDAQDTVQLPFSAASGEGWFEMDEVFDGPNGQEYQAYYGDNGEGGFDNGPILLIGTCMNIEWI